MHLVRTFKTVELFKVPLCEGISLNGRNDKEAEKKEEKRRDVRT